MKWAARLTLRPSGALPRALARYNRLDVILIHYTRITHKLVAVGQSKAIRKNKWRQ